MKNEKNTHDSCHLTKLAGMYVAFHVTFRDIFDYKKSSIRTFISNPSFFCVWPTLAGGAGPGQADRARPVTFLVTGRSQTQPVIFQSRATSAHSGARDSNLSGGLPGLAHDIPRSSPFFLRAVSPPPRVFVAATRSLARAQQFLWAAARCLHSAYGAEPAMPLCPPSDTVRCRVDFAVP